MLASKHRAPPRPAPACLSFPRQTTLFHFFGYSYGSAAFYLSKLAGVADKALVPVSQLVLKVRGGGRAPTSVVDAVTSGGSYAAQAA